MKSNRTTNSDGRSPGKHTFPVVSPLSRIGQGSEMDSERLREAVLDLENKLQLGLSDQVAETAARILDSYGHPLDVQVTLVRLIALSFQMQGNFAGAVSILGPFEASSVASKLSQESLCLLQLHLGSAHTYNGSFDAAIPLLSKALRIAEDRELTPLLLDINLAFSHVYREIRDYPVSRNYAEKALKYARDLGDWRKLAESYQMMAVGHLREGNADKSIELTRFAIKIVGDRQAPFLLGKLYSGISVGYSALFQPEEGIRHLKKALTYFESTGDRFHTAAAYNNLGTNLILNGEWQKAEEILDRAVELGSEIDHVHLSTFLSTRGELSLVRGDYQAAEKLFNQAVDAAAKETQEWYSVQISYFLAKCYLRQDRIDDAIAQARLAVERCAQIKENFHRLRAATVIAEALIISGRKKEADKALSEIESDPAFSNFVVQGKVAMLRGAMAKNAGDLTLAEQHFNRAVSVYDLAGDIRNKALAELELGKTLLASEPKKAEQHLRESAEIFRRLDLESKALEAESSIAAKTGAKSAKAETKAEEKTHLLMVRLLEAATSRELVLRELVSVLHQEGNVKRSIVAETRDERRLTAVFINGFASNLASELLGGLQSAIDKDEIEEFASAKDLQVLTVVSPNSKPAYVVVSPAAGVILKDGSPFDSLLRAAENGLELSAIREKFADGVLETTLTPTTSKGVIAGFIHSSPAMTELVNDIRKIRTSNVNVLITGESGTGKELVARSVHMVSTRKDRVFVPFNCTAVPKELTEGHLFGYRKGAFTGASSDSEGMIRAADGGTLFLDEIGDLPLDVQPKILRFLQEGEVQPLGENAPVKVDVRIIAATNMNLEERVIQGLFREDLYYRLNVVRLRIPPLRDRRSEIPQLVDHYLAVYSERFGREGLYDLVAGDGSADCL
jgi:hydrogenase-4 transcriptional activator